MIRSLLIMSLIALAGCASTQQATVNFVNGKAFWAGDAQCSHHVQSSDPNIMICSDSVGRPTGERRRALSDQELQYVTSQQQINAQQQAYQTNVPVRIPQYNVSVPQPAPLNSYGASQVRCINVNTYTNCRSY